MTWTRLLILGCILLMCSPDVRSGDWCRSIEFKKAFVDSGGGIDSPTYNQNLIRAGEKAVGCLTRIVRDGGEYSGISVCQKNRDSCRLWALGALGEIGTPRALEYVRTLLSPTTPKDLLERAVGVVAGRRMREARPDLLKLLHHDVSSVRALAVLALGSIGERSDFEAMADTVRGLPTENIPDAVRGLELLGDTRAIPLLEELQARTPPGGARTEIDGALARFKSGRTIKPSPR